MFRGLGIGVGIAIGFLIGMVGCTAGLAVIGANSIDDTVSQRFDEIASELDADAVGGDEAKVDDGKRVVNVSDVPSSGLLEVKVDSLTEGQFGNADAIVRVDNKTNRSYSMIFVDCAFLGSGERAIESGTAMITNLGAGQSGYGEATAMNGEEIKSVRCRISQTM
jgi:hypothetical protein